MNILKYIGIAVAGTCLGLAFTFPKIAMIAVAIWSGTGIINHVFFWKTKKSWSSADTIRCIPFIVFGPITFLLNRSKDPRL